VNARYNLTGRPHGPATAGSGFAASVAVRLAPTLSLMPTIVTIGDAEYSFTRGSDVVRDGMFLEAELVGESTRRTVAEVFYSDETGRFFVSCFVEAVPLELIEYLISEGRKRLPPTEKHEI
jgi:hypothetical protein